MDNGAGGRTEKGSEKTMTKGVSALYYLSTAENPSCLNRQDSSPPVDSERKRLIIIVYTQSGLEHPEEFGKEVKSLSISPSNVAPHTRPVKHDTQLAPGTPKQS